MNLFDFLAVFWQAFLSTWQIWLLGAFTNTLIILDARRREHED